MGYESVNLTKYVVLCPYTNEKGVFCDTHDDAKAQAAEFAGMGAAKLIAIYTYESHAEVGGLTWHRPNQKKHKKPRKSPSPRPENNYKKWKTKDDDFIVQALDNSWSHESIAEALGRSIKAIGCRISMLEVAGRLS